MYHICLVPGLGVDERIFQNLRISSEYPQTVLQWIKPEPNEKLPSYAARLRTQIPAHQQLIFIGVSFGGIIAIELAKLLPSSLTIIVSSIKTCREMPWFYKLAGRISLPYLVPVQWGKYMHHLQDYIFGPQSPAEARLLHQIIAETDLVFVRWALNQTANWPNQTLVNNLVHLHGTNDKIFPIKYLRKFIPIANGEHLMVVSQAELMSKLINTEISKLLTES